MTNTISILAAHKGEPMNAFVVVLYQRLMKEAVASNPTNRRLTFTQVSYVFGAVYRLPKPLHFQFLKKMQNRGLVKIKPYHHILLLDSDL